MLKLGYSVSRSTVRNVLKGRHIPPSSQRKRKGTTWRIFLGHYSGQMIACDFLTVETVWLQTLFVLFFIELGTRRVHLAGCTAQPTSAWVTQQARNLTWEMEDLGDRDRELPIRFLIHDRDAKFTSSFDTVFALEGIETVLTPYRYPKANAFAERWVRTVGDECLDRLLIIGEGHLRRVLSEYTEYYNRRRAHQGIGQRIPVPDSETRAAKPAARSPVGLGRREVLGYTITTITEVTAMLHSRFTEHGRILAQYSHNLQGQAAADLMGAAQTMQDAGRRLAQNGQETVDYAERLRCSLGFALTLFTNL